MNQLLTTFTAAPHPYLAEKHTFSSKERDAETGLSYFGARYYSSELSLWLSVDPMSGKYPSLSPYVYCANNPMKLVDPNGEAPITAIIEGVGAFVSTAGVSFLSNWLFDGQDCSTAFNNVTWGAAALDGITTFAKSLILGGRGSYSHLNKIANSKAGKFASSIIHNMVTNIAQQMEKGEKFAEIDLKAEFIYATFSSIMEFGLDKRGNELLEKIKSTDQTLYKRCLKQERNIMAQKNDARLRSDARQVSIAKKTASNAKEAYARYYTKNAGYSKSTTATLRELMDK